MANNETKLLLPRLMTWSRNPFTFTFTFAVAFTFAFALQLSITNLKNFIISFFLPSIAGNP